MASEDFSEYASQTEPELWSGVAKRFVLWSSRQIDDYNPNSVQTLSIIKVGSVLSTKEVELQSPLLGNDNNYVSILGSSPQL